RLLEVLVGRQPELVEPLVDGMLSVDPAELLAIRQVLLSHRDVVVPRLWAAALDSTATADRRLHAAAALAGFDATDERWTALVDAVLPELLKSDAVYAEIWTQALSPVRKVLVPRLATHARSEAVVQTRFAAATILSRLVADDMATYVDVALDS